MIRNQDDNHVADRSSAINSASEIPKKPYRVTVEFPLFLVMISATLTGGSVRIFLGLHLFYKSWFNYIAASVSGGAVVTVISSAVSNIILYRTCVHSLSYSHEECKGFLSPVKTNDTNKLEQEVQVYATYVSTVKSILDAIGPAVLSLFLGAWSDTYGRKPLITWSLFGTSITAMLTVIYSVTDSYGPWWYILTGVPTSLSGGLIVLFTASYCYISDVSPTDKTTIRMALVDATVSAGMVLGPLLAKDLILNIGNVYLLLIGSTLNVLAYFYACLFIPESLTGALKGGFSKILDISLVKEMARECFKHRPNNGRVQILLLTAVTMLSVFATYGLVILEYMYTRGKLHWALADYNTYSAVGTAIAFCGGFIGIYVAQNLLGISDLIFAILSVFTAAIGFFIKAFALTTWQMYLAATVSVFRGLSSPLIRSHLTKSLPVEDIAKVFAMMCSLEGITPLVAPVIFTTIYTTTINSFPGTFLLVNGVLTVICMILLGFVKYYASRSNRVSYDTLNQQL